VVVTVSMSLPVPVVSVTLGVLRDKLGGVNARGDMDVDKATELTNPLRPTREIVD